VAFGSGATGTLQLDHSLTAPFAGQLSGLSEKNAVDLVDLTWSNPKTKMTATFAANAVNPTSGGVLTVSNGSQSVKLNLSGNYTTASWTFGPARRILGQRELDFVDVDRRKCRRLAERFQPCFQYPVDQVGSFRAARPLRVFIPFAQHDFFAV
jgi:hypothetical protein